MKYFVWLSLCLTNKDFNTKGLLERFASPEEIYSLARRNSSELRAYLKKPPKDLFSEDIKRAEDICEKCREKGIKIIPFNSPEYPRAFLRLKDFPVCIYAYGNTQILNGRAVFSVAGARQKKEDTYREVGRLSFDAGKMGAVVCSGLAYGIDTAALEGAVLSGSKTIGILGCSIDVNYPMGNRELKKKMLKYGGVLLSEYPIKIPAFPYNFTFRNRLIAALGDVLLAVSSESSKGTYITVGAAMEMDNMILTVKGRAAIDEKGADTLSEMGAIEIESAGEMLPFFPAGIAKSLKMSKIVKGEYEKAKAYLEREEKAPIPKETPKQLREKSEEELERLFKKKRKYIRENFPEETRDIPTEIFDMLMKKECTAEEIIEKSSFKAPQIFDYLIRLQLMDIVETPDGKVYVISRKQSYF